MKSELTVDEMIELGFDRVEKLYVKREDGFICYALVLSNGNAPVGGRYYEVKPMAREMK